MKIKNRLLVLYDKNDFVEASFDKYTEAEKYTGMPLETLKKQVYRKACFKDGRKLIWIKV